MAVKMLTIVSQLARIVRQIPHSTEHICTFRIVVVCVLTLVVCDFILY